METPASAGVFFGLPMLAVTRGASHNAAMALPRTAFALALLVAGLARGEDKVTVYRCVDAKGNVSLQGDPCPTGSSQSTRQMQRPVDAPAKPAATPKPAATTAATHSAAPPAEPSPSWSNLIPPPPMFICTSYDGIERTSEVYDPNPRCEPLALYYHGINLTPAQAGLCHWVQDSCVRMSDDEACALFKKKKQEAVSAALHAFSDTAAYRKSEVVRLTQIIEESCP